jgi:choline kinase
MEAIILAAGVGRRLGNCSDNKPKCMLEFDGISLLRRHLSILNHYNISNIIVVTGYQADKIINEIACSESSHITNTIYNPDFEKGSLNSLLIGLKGLTSNESFLLMDADVLYDHKIIQRLVKTKFGNCFLLDQNFIPGDEPVKLCVRDGHLVDFRKKIDEDLEFDFQGESVGFFRFTAETANKLKKQTMSYLAINNDDAPYEEIIRDLLFENPDSFGFEDVTGLKWIEIDFPEDIDRAQTEILPNIAQVKI